MARKFEAAIHNETVRRLVNSGERHHHLDDAWADTHYVEIRADTADDARSRLTRRYPSDQGYVIEEISLSDD